jgi:hypothetical protein
VDAASVGLAGAGATAGAALLGADPLQLCLVGMDCTLRARRPVRENQRGRRWSPVPVAIPDRVDARFDLPWLDGDSGVVSATVGTRPPTESGRTWAVAFGVERGRTWTARSTGRIASCPLNAYYTASWPVSIVNSRVW